MRRAFRTLSSLLVLLALALAGPGCASRQSLDPIVTQAWETQTGQLMYRAKGGRSIIGDFAVRQKDNEGFVLLFSSGPGIPLMKLQQSAAGASVEGVLARGRWSGRPEAAPKHLRGWNALGELFANLPAKTANLAGTGWNARLVRDSAGLRSLEVTFVTTGERFVFHFAR